MSKTIDLTELDDPRDGIHQAVQALVEGACVSLPMEEGGVVCRLATAPELSGDVDDAIAGSTLPSAMLFGHVETAADFLPELTPTQARVLLRAHPGHAIFRVDREADGPLSEFPEWTQRVVGGDSSIDLRIAGRVVPAAVLSLLPAPVVAGPGCETGPVEVELLDRQPVLGQPSLISLENGQVQLLHQHLIDDRDISSLAGVQIVLVCTGNTCRSPMAEAVLKGMLAEELQVPVDQLGSAGVSVISAGVATGGGSPASPEAVRAVAELGLDLSQHRSRTATVEMLERADVVLTMTQGHRATIVSQAPSLSELVQTLSPDGRDVDDPIGGPASVYQSCLKQIRGAIEARFSELVSLVRELRDARK